MTSRYNTRKFSDRVRPKDDETSFTQQDQSGVSDLDPTKQATASQGSQATSANLQSSDTTGASSQQGYSSKYHYVHDELSHPDE
ncbi:hypothetical protein BDV29DRAFT_158316 [Aspergillus leporis]|uniref:Uncharacterized protein n=1 Tax=Aspergillus leporis TaxID=41062 RepID=A0A5N5X002_9EURO|nr:hypothetical protein BDV29DRAFT_158316 [Aspergillus leporis]